MANEPTATAARIPYEGTDCTAEEAVEAVEAVRATAALMEALAGLTEAQREHFLRHAVEAALTYKASGDPAALIRFADGLLASAELRQRVPSYRTAFTAPG